MNNRSKTNIMFALEEHRTSIGHGEVYNIFALLLEEKIARSGQAKSV